MAVGTIPPRLGFVPPSAATSGNGRTVASLVVDPVRRGEGIRVGVVGDSGTGKTWALAAITRAWTEATAAGIAFVADDAGQAIFPGERRIDVRDLADRPPTGRVVVFAGDPFAGRTADAQAVAAVAWGMARRRVPSVVVIDELSRLSTSGRWRAGDTSPVPRAFREGRKHNLSVAWATQSPAGEPPREAFEQSALLLVFHVSGRGLRYLERVYDLPPEAVAAVAALPDALVDPAGRGRFVLLRRGAFLGSYRFD